MRRPLPLPVLPTLPLPVLLLLLVALALALALPAMQPAPQPELRLFSDGWGASSFVDGSFCTTAQGGEPPAMVMRPKPPAVAAALDRLTLAAQYLGWGLLLPVVAVAAALHARRAARFPELLLYGLLGLAPAYFEWTLSPACVALRQALAQAWMARWPLGDSALPWLDGAALALWLAGGCVLAGGLIHAAVWCAGRLLHTDWRGLARDLLPLALATLVLGLTQSTALYLRGEGATLGWLAPLRATLLVAGVAASAGLGLRTIASLAATGRAAKTVALLLWKVPLTLGAAHGWAMHFHWSSRYHV